MDAEELTAEEIGELREDHQVLHGKVEDWCSAPACHENWPCTSSRFLASIDSLRTQLAEAQKNADAFEMEWDKALIGRKQAEAREAALRDALDDMMCIEHREYALTKEQDCIVTNGAEWYCRRARGLGALSGEGRQ